MNAETKVDPITSLALTDEVVRDVWCALNEQLRDSTKLYDPLSPQERALYDVLTVWLTARARIVMASVSDGNSEKDTR